ncbi:MAG: NAD(P)-dependent oxidoreductase [Verrucomicrobiota bacterium]
MKVLVTGARGRVGRRLVPYLKQKGIDVRTTDVPGIYPEVSVDVEVDLVDREACFNLTKDCDAVVHMGNYSNPYPKNDKAWPQAFTNIRVNANVFEASHENNVSKIIFFSSIWVMLGDSFKFYQSTPSSWETNKLPFRPNKHATPGTPYGIAKYVSEQTLEGLVRMNPELSAISFRFPFLAPPGCLNKLPNFTNDRDRDELFSYLSFDDLFKLLSLALKKMKPGYSVYFPASRKNKKGKDPEDLVREFFPNIPRRNEGEQLTSIIDISSLETDFDWVPQD